jgi:hypothetical protein
VHEMPRVGRRALAVLVLALAIAGAAWLLASCARPNDEAPVNDPDAYGPPEQEVLGPGDAPDIPYWHARDVHNPDFLCTRCHPNQHDNQYEAPDGCLFCHKFE